MDKCILYGQEELWDSEKFLKYLESLLEGNWNDLAAKIFCNCCSKKSNNTLSQSTPEMDDEHHLACFPKQLVITADVNSNVHFF